MSTPPGKGAANDTDLPCCVKNVLPAASAAATTTAAATGAGLVLGLVDFQSPAAQFLAVQGLDGRVGALVVHLDEAEAAQTAGFPVGDEVDADHLTVRGEMVADIVFRRREGQVANIKFLRHGPSEGVPF